MSRTEFHTGKLYPVKSQGTLEETCKVIAKRFNVELGDDWQEDFMDHFDEYSNKRGKVNEEYFIHGENLYRVIDHEESEDDEYYMNLKRTADGGISFVGTFYNGGTCFSEMLEEALDNLAPSFQEQIKNAIDEIVEKHNKPRPKTVPSAGALILEHMGKEKAIELFEGAVKEAMGDIFRSSAYESTLEHVIKKENDIN
jgi:hypothetical protein